MKFKTALLFGFCIAASATAGPITFKVTSQALTFTFKSDTNGVVNKGKTPLPCCSPALSTPITRTNLFTTEVFVNPLEEEVGIWFEPESLVSAATAFATPISPLIAGALSTSRPDVALQAAITPPATSVNPNTSVSPTISASPTTAASGSVTQTAPRTLVPESSTFTLLMIGVGCLLIGKFRRKAT